MSCKNRGGSNEAMRSRCSGSFCDGDDEHVISLNELCSRLNTDGYCGLTCSYARSLLKKEGINKYSRPNNKNDSILRKLFKSKPSQDSWTKRDWDRIFNSKSNVEYVVIRNGQKSLVRKLEIVKGDLVSLTLGQIVPADMRVISYEGQLMVDNRIITGNPTELKSNSPTSTDFLLSQNMIFAGTVLIKGSCEAIVLKTGNETVFGELTQFATKVRYIKRPHSDSLSSVSSGSTSSIGTSSSSSMNLSLASSLNISETSSMSLAESTYSL